VVNIPTFHEEVKVLRIPIIKYIEDVVPEAREGDGVLVFLSSRKSS
jgi:hypothetical protein